jgi:RNA polymerase-interacting CarD/CdnL/TRCF family regulator
MDYKSVLEEQIRELQKVQDEKGLHSSERCQIAEQIRRLVVEASLLQGREPAATGSVPAGVKSGISME